jgi:hypothetical protein
MVHTIIRKLLLELKQVVAELGLFSPSNSAFFTIFVEESAVFMDPGMTDNALSSILFAPCFKIIFTTTHTNIFIMNACIIITRNVTFQNQINFAFCAADIVFLNNPLFNSSLFFGSYFIFFFAAKSQ